MRSTSKNIYQKKVKRVLDRQIPEKCHCLFICKDQTLKLELIINPILSPHRSNKLVLVIGQILDKIENLTDIDLNLLSYPESYENLLTTIVDKIRHHLTLENIWLQGVETLGQTLQVSGIGPVAIEYDDVSGDKTNDLIVANFNSNMIFRNEMQNSDYGEMTFCYFKAFDEIRRSRGVAISLKDETRISDRDISSFM
ncbi:MAG: hypothetical protein HC932_03175, partial [Thermales bacterium]|nr:hypothetical protein [Thermales bacterium]